MARTILISGASEGIGKATTELLLANGYNVSAFSRSKDKCAQLEKELAEKFPQGSFLVSAGDVTSTQDIERIYASTLEKFAQVDVLYNNAGFGVYCDIEEYVESDFSSMMETNMLAVAKINKLLIPEMKKRGSGHIINLVSIAGKAAFPKSAYYCATKFALLGYSKGLRQEMKPHGIKVTTICPGMVRTPFFSPQELERREALNNGPMPMLEPLDVAKTVHFVCEQSDTCCIEDLDIMPWK